MAIKGYWRLDGNSNDASGSGYNGSDTDITYSQANGVLNGGAGFNGSSSAISVGDINEIEGVGTLTICALIYPTVNNGRGMIVAKDAASNRSFFLQKSDNSADNRIGFMIGDQSTGSYQAITQVVINKWTHIIVVYDKSGANQDERCKFYFNGKFEPMNPLQTTANANIPSTGSNVQIGARQYTTSRQFFTGKIDEVLVDPTAWTPARIKNEYARIKGFI